MKKILLLLCSVSVLMGCQKDDEPQQIINNNTTIVQGSQVYTLITSEADVSCESLLCRVTVNYDLITTDVLDNGFVSFEFWDKIDNGWRMGNVRTIKEKQVIAEVAEQTLLTRFGDHYKITVIK